MRARTTLLLLCTLACGGCGGGAPPSPEQVSACLEAKGWETQIERSNANPDVQAVRGRGTAAALVFFPDEAAARAAHEKGSPMVQFGGGESEVHGSIDVLWFAADERDKETLRAC